MELGRLAAIWRYPIKSLAGESMTQAVVLSDGLEGDHERALLVRDGHPRVGKTYRGKENDRLHTLAQPEAAVQSANHRGVTVDPRTTRRNAFSTMRRFLSSSIAGSMA